MTNHRTVNWTLNSGPAFWPIPPTHIMCHPTVVLSQASLNRYEKFPLKLLTNIIAHQCEWTSYISIITPMNTSGLVITKEVATNTGRRTCSLLARDMGRCNVRPLFCHRRSYSTSAHISSLPTRAVATNTQEYVRIRICYRYGQPRGARPVNICILL